MGLNGIAIYLHAPLKSNIDVFFVTSFLCSLPFLLFHRIDYPKRCLWKKIFYGFFVILWYLQKAMYRPCDLDIWPMKVQPYKYPV